MREDVPVPMPLPDALAQLRALLLRPDLVRAVGSGRRRGEQPAHLRVELRPVRLKAGPQLQRVTTDGRQPITTNLTAQQAQAAVDELVAEPFGSWHVRTAELVWQLRVTKRGQAQVHQEAAPGRGAGHTADDGAPAADRHDRAKSHLLDPGDPIFAALGAGADKRRQVDAFLRLLAPTADRAVAAAARAGRPLRVVDLGCGNAYLTVAAHRWLSDRHPDTRTVGVDSRPGSAARNAQLADRLGLTGLTFVTGQIAEADVGPADLVLALHACDTATDDALARAVTWGSAVVLAAPCCHHDLQRQLVDRRRQAGELPAPFGAVGRDGILLERLADALTDSLRAALLRLLGYRVEVVEFIDSRHTPRNLMIRAVLTGSTPDARRRSEYAELADFWQVEPALAQRLAEPVAAALRRS